MQGCYKALERTILNKYEKIKYDRRKYINNMKVKDVEVIGVSGERPET